MTSPPATIFERTIDTLDNTVLVSAQKHADNVRRLKLATKRPRGEAPPFHGEEDTFSAAIQAVSALARVSPPTTLNLRTEPQTVYSWVIEAMISFGRECRQEGMQMERASQRPRINPNDAEEALQLMQKLNALLSKR